MPFSKLALCSYTPYIHICTHTGPEYRTDALIAVVVAILNAKKIAPLFGKMGKGYFFFAD